MATTVSRQLQLLYSGDINNNMIKSAADNVAAYGGPYLVRLLSGDNTITAPIVTGVTIGGLSIVPPAGNTTLIKLKSVTTDAGVPIHKTDLTSLGLDSTFVSLVLNAAAEIDGVLLAWS